MGIGSLPTVLPAQRAFCLLYKLLRRIMDAEEPSLDGGGLCNLGVVVLATAWTLGSDKAGLSSILALSSSVTLGKCPDLSLASVFCSVKRG